jgi:hypothetical protein
MFLDGMLSPGGILSWWQVFLWYIVSGQIVRGHISSGVLSMVADNGGCIMSRGIFSRAMLTRGILSPGIMSLHRQSDLVAVAVCRNGEVQGGVSHAQGQCT